MTFKLNDKVTWTSQSQGSTKTKVGTVVEVLPPKKRLLREHMDYGLYGGNPRDHESYVVHVPGKTDKAKGRRYWPHVSALKAAK